MKQRAQVRTGDQALVREINLSLILDYLREDGPISRAALAELTGLNKTTVSSIIQELIGHQFVREVGYDTSGVGRPAMLLEINPNAGTIVSAEIGVDFISVIRTDFAPEVVWQERDTIRPAMGQRTIIDRTLALLRLAIEEDGNSGGNLLGIAVGVPGLVDREAEDVLFAPNLGWRDVPLGSLLRETFEGVQVFVDNEANLAALGEYYFGSAQGYDEVLYLSAGVGLGGGIVRNGRLFRGKTGLAGEFGHMTIDPEGDLCNCGNRGCWETLVGQRNVFRKLQQSLQQGVDGHMPMLVERDDTAMSVPFVIELATEGDKATLEVLDRLGCHLGIGIASLVNAFNPDLVVLGGSLSAAADYVLPAAKRELEKRALEWNRGATRIVRAWHGSDACLMGGVATVYQTILAHPVDSTR
jgi:glucokinase-like ROK family protein